MLPGGAPASIGRFFNHPKVNSHVSYESNFGAHSHSFNFWIVCIASTQYVFTDTTNKYIFTTTDYVNTVSSYKLDFTPDDITFDERKPFSLLAYDKVDRLRRVRSTSAPNIPQTSSFFIISLLGHRTAMVQR